MVVFMMKKFGLSHGAEAVRSQRQRARTRRSANWFPQEGFRGSSQKGPNDSTWLMGTLRLEVPPPPCGAGGRFGAIACRGGGMLRGYTPHPCTRQLHCRAFPTTYSKRVIRWHRCFSRKRT